MILLVESKRDDLLLPYFELVKDKIPGLTLGKFKGVMLDKLAAQGNINNLSLGSNFYLAGATRYYFQGQLTLNGQVNLLKGDTTTPDVWNEDACRKLNALINILRNSYIDSIGTKFEIEEDFGNLPINRLFRKYGKKIDAELGINNVSDEEKPKAPEIDRNPEVGNGYTFDILYSFNDATKYNSYTSPGAWCITYGQQHYDYYRRHLGIHYVIFLKKGYENVKRQTGPGYTRQKPHDKYGNSMIAFLQKNDSWMPTYITSRWNHGYHGDGTSGTEADHAYTLEEFCEITGVTPDDLQRIYKIWKTDVKNKKDDDDEVKIDRAELKIAMTSVLRKLKYAQITINNGQNPSEALAAAGATLESTLYGDGEQQKKSVCEYKIAANDMEFLFICDRTNIIFDSLAEFSMVEFATGQQLWGGSHNGQDIIVFNYETYSKLYSVRYHSFIDIGGKTKFKRLPERQNPGAAVPLFIEVKNSFKDIALLSLSSGKPLKLPNGQYWFNEVKFDNGGGRWEPRNTIVSHIIYDTFGSIIEIVYDESSREKYFYSLKAKKFVDYLKNIDNNEHVDCWSRNAIQDPHQYEVVLMKGMAGVDGYSAIAFSPDGTTYRTTKSLLIDDNGNQLNIYKRDRFDRLTGHYGRFISYDNGTTADNWYKNFEFYDIVTKKLVAIGKQPLVTNGNIEYCGRYLSISKNDMPRYFFFRNPGYSDSTYKVYDSTVGLLVKNPFTGRADFKLETTGNALNGDDVTFYKDDFNTYNYANTLQGDYDTRWEKAMEERAKHLVYFNRIDLEYFPNNLPVNDEYSKSKHQQNEPAVALREEKIREAVANAIKKILK